MAYITRYIFGTDKLRPNAFEVRGMNGSNTGVIHINDLAVLSHWIKLISDYITGLTNHKGNNKIWTINFDTNAESCIKGLLVVRDFCFSAIWAAGPVNKKSYEQLLRAVFSFGVKNIFFFFNF